jgi:hypothetical protein
MHELWILCIAHAALSLLDGGTLMMYARCIRLGSFTGLVSLSLTPYNF